MPIAPVLLHGFTGSGDRWPAAVRSGLADALGVEPVFLDLPGHGEGKRGDPPPAVSSEAAFDLLDRSLGSGAAPLVGYSMGGRIALAYACTHPGRVSALVLESASPGLDTEAGRKKRRTADEALARSLEREGIEAFVDRWERLPLFATQRSLPDAVAAAQRAGRLRNDPDSLAAALRTLGTGALPPMWEALPDLDVPVLLVVGSLDTKFVAIAERMTARLPQARLTVVPDAGHAVHLERPRIWVERVAAFLAEV